MDSRMIRRSYDPMTTPEPIRSQPPTCERCGHTLPGPNQLAHRSPGKYGRYNPDHPPRSPVRVVKPSPDGEQVTWWCSSRCFNLANEKPEKKKLGKPSADSQFHLTRAA